MNTFQLKHTQTDVDGFVLQNIKALITEKSFYTLVSKKEQQEKPKEVVTNLSESELDILLTKDSLNVEQLLSGLYTTVPFEGYDTQPVKYVFTDVRNIVKMRFDDWVKKEYFPGVFSLVQYSTPEYVQLMRDLNSLFAQALINNQEYTQMILHQLKDKVKAQQYFVRHTQEDVSNFLRKNISLMVEDYVFYTQEKERDRRVEPTDVVVDDYVYIPITKRSLKTLIDEVEFMDALGYLKQDSSYLLYTLTNLFIKNPKSTNTSQSNGEFITLIKQLRYEFNDWKYEYYFKGVDSKDSNYEQLNKDLEELFLNTILDSKSIYLTFIDKTNTKLTK